MDINNRYQAMLSRRNGGDPVVMQREDALFSESASSEPTSAQLAAGNYRKRKTQFQGLNISIENEAGSVRRGVDLDGKPWETRMLVPYGYIRGSEGLDGDHVDVFLGSNPDAEFAYVIDQKLPPEFTELDEQKVMLGHDSLGEACWTYLQHYNDSRFLGPVKVMPMVDFIAAVRLTVDGEPFIKSFKGHKGRQGKRGGSLPDDDAGMIEDVLIRHALPWRHLDFSPAAWEVEFPGGFVDTPFGPVKLGENQHSKVDTKDGGGRHRYFGLIRPTLENPAYVISELETDEKVAERRKNGEQVDRPAVLKFIRAFIDKHGKYHGFACVSVARDGVEVSVSSSPRGVRRLARAVKSGAILNFGHPKPSETATLEGEDGTLLKAVSFDHLTAFDNECNDGFTVFDYSLFEAIVSCGDDSLHKALGVGEHWITVHPPGHEKGTPLLIQDHPDGTATVIGGAGGSMNHLKLRATSKGKDLKSSLKEKHAARQEAKKEQIAADKAAGIHGAKKEARKQITAEVKKGRKEFIALASELAGWSKEETEFDESKHSGLSPAAVEKARVDHEKSLFKRAKETVDLNRKVLVEDGEARAASGLGEVPLTSADPDQLSVADLNPMPEVSGAKLGFDAKYSERAGVSPEEAKAEATEAVSGSDTVKPAPDEAKAKEKVEIKEAIANELTDFALKNPDCSPPKASILADAKKAAALLKAYKKMRLIEKKGRDAQRELSDAPMVESKAHVLEVSDAEIEEATKQQMEDDVRTSGARSFLAALESEGGEAKVAGHIGTGAFNSLNAASTALGGEALMDRSVVDVLGVAGAAQVLARRIQSDMGADADKVRQGIEDWHVANSDSLQTGAVAKAKELHDAAAAIELPEGSTGFDLATAQEANAKRRDAVAAAQKILGQAHGEMQAGAALVAAMQGKQDKVEVSLGILKPEAAVIQLRAIGLKPGEYHLEQAGDNLVATITGAGMDKLAKPIDVDGMAQIRRNLDIMEGKDDEDGWLPLGIANRPDLSMHVEPGVAARLSQPIDFTGGPEQALKDYIGGRMADGDAMVDILADAQSADFFQKSGDPDSYRKALDSVASLKGDDGKMKPIESLREAWDQHADDFVSSKYGADRSPINKQSFDVDQTSVDALHRALTETPDGVAAFKPIGDLSPKERNGLRNWWLANVAKEGDGAAEKRMALESHIANEPEKESQDMFGDTSVNPDWHAWSSKKDELSGAVKSGKLDWPRYVEMLGSPAAAIETVQDLIRSRVSNKFAEAYNTAKPTEPLKLGRTTVRNNLDHLDAVDPKARADRAAKEKALIDGMRERVDGKYASGSVKEKLGEQKEKQAAFEQAQMGFFSADEAPATSSALGSDERHTIGHAAEQKLAGMMSVVGQNFKPGQPTKLWNASMGTRDAQGKKNPDFARQRLIKMLEENGRVTAAFGTGSGKSLLQLAGFTHLHEKGKVKKGVILAPSIVQGQFGGEALRYLEPGKYKWHAEMGASRDERLAAYRDPDTHFVVATHQSFRDDMIHVGASHAGIPHAEMADKLQKMTAGQRKEWASALMEKEGFKFGYMSTDESQYTLNRDGKENSRLANVTDAFSDNADYYMPSSGDPVKNDVSEAHDLLSKMDRKRYADKGAFMRRYGGDAISAKESLKREMSRYVYASKIDPDVKADRKVINVPLNDHQKSALASLNKDASAARIAHMDGGVAVEEMKRLSPESFANAPEEKHGEIAKALQSNVGMLKNSATKRILNVNEKGAKMDKISEMMAERKGTPGVIFSHNVATVEHLRARLEKEGHRVVTISGADSSLEKDKKRLMFQPESGEPEADIVIASDAAATGLNLQRGSFVVQMDTPDTAMTWQQRRGRCFRTGQKNNVELIDLVADHPSEKKARERLSKKNDLRELMTSPMEGLDDTGVAYYLKQRLSQQEQGGLF